MIIFTSLFCSGVGLIMTRAKVLGKLVSKARRYFEPTALREVWAELRPAVLAVDRRPSEGYEALGYLQLFAPTHNLCRCELRRCASARIRWPPCPACVTLTLMSSVQAS